VISILGFPVDADILAQIENLKSGKDAVKVTTSQGGFIYFKILKSLTKRHCLKPVLKPPVDSSQLLQLLIIALVAYYFKDIMAMIKSYL